MVAKYSPLHTRDGNDVMGIGKLLLCKVYKYRKDKWSHLGISCWNTGELVGLMNLHSIWRQANLVVSVCQSMYRTYKLVLSIVRVYMTHVLVVICPGVC